jgi:hypothetical protein
MIFSDRNAPDVPGVAEMAGMLENTSIIQETI